MRWKIIEPPSMQRVCCDGNCKTAYDLYRILCLCPRLDRIWSVPDLMHHPLSVRCCCVMVLIRDQRFLFPATMPNRWCSLLFPVTMPNHWWPPIPCSQAESPIPSSRLSSDQKETKLSLFGGGNIRLFWYRVSLCHDEWLPKNVGGRHCVEAPW